MTVITELGAGGAEKVVAVLTAGLLRLGHDPVVISLSTPPDNKTIPDLLAKNGVRVRYLQSGKHVSALLAELKSVIREERPDVIHSHLMHPNLLCRAAVKGLDIPLINTIHIAERRKGKWHYFLLDRITFRMADYVYAVSESAARFHETCCKLPAMSIGTIYNGVKPVIPADPLRCEELKRKWGLDKTAKIIGSIGRFDWQKGYDLLLSRLDKLSESLPAGETWGILILGDGPEREKLDLLAKQANGKYKNLIVRLPGFQPDAASLMTMFDAFVMPSRYEGYGLALAEAMSLGLPVVCSCADSLPELCRRYTGMNALVPMDQDPEGALLALDLIRAAKSPKTEPMILMTEDEMVRKCVSVYQDALERHRHE